MRAISLFQSPILKFFSSLLLFVLLSACTHPTQTTYTTIPHAPTSTINAYPVPATIPLSNPYLLPPTPYPPVATLPEIPPPNITAVITATIQNLPHPIPRRIRSVSFTDPQHGWVAAERSIFNTSDGGENWSWVTDTPGNIWHIDFMDEQQGWLFTSNGLFRSNDSGLSWQTVALSSTIITETASIKDIDFNVMQRGWIVLKDQFLRTNDSGASWAIGSLPCAEVLPATMAGVEHRTISLIGEQEAWLICGGEAAGAMRLAWKWLFYTPDNGKNWYLVTDASPNNFPAKSSNLASGMWPDLFFLDNSHGWVGTYSTLLYTQNGGTTWTTISVPSIDKTISDPQFFSPKDGIISWEESGESILLKTQDGGATWQPIFPPPLPHKVQFIDDRNGFGVGLGPFANFVFQTRDGGRSWVQVGKIGKTGWEYPDWKPNDDKCISFFLAIDFIDLKSGWVTSQGCPEPNSVFITGDGGKTWIRSNFYLPPYSESYISAVDFKAVFLYNSSAKTLYRSSDGAQTFDIYHNLYSPGYKFQYISPTEIAKLNKGALYGTTNGGKTWKGILNNHQINDYEYLPGGYFWVLPAILLQDDVPSKGPYQPYLLYSPNYGLSWKMITFGDKLPIEFPNSYWANISFIDSQRGWLYTLDHLYATQDGGYSWIMVR